jgi:hypothetical protein
VVLVEVQESLVPADRSGRNIVLVDRLLHVVYQDLLRDPEHVKGPGQACQQDWQLVWSVFFVAF